MTPVAALPEAEAAPQPRPATVSVLTKMSSEYVG
jgi:hypothetical protein